LVVILRIDAVLRLNFEVELYRLPCMLGFLLSHCISAYAARHFALHFEWLNFAVL
jgi:hypothetical protein